MHCPGRVGWHPGGRSALRGSTAKHFPGGLQGTASCPGTGDVQAGWALQVPGARGLSPIALPVYIPVWAGGVCVCIPQPMCASCCVVAMAKPTVGHRCRAPWPRTAVPGLASAPSSCACVTGVGVAVCVPSATQTPAGQHWPQQLRGTSGTHTCTCMCQGRGQKPPCAAEPPRVLLHCGREPEQLTQQVPARGTACVSWRGREHAAGRAAPSTDVELPTRAKLGKGPRGGTVTSAGAGLKGDSACLPARGKCNG